MGVPKRDWPGQLRNSGLIDADNNDIFRNGLGEPGAQQAKLRVQDSEIKGFGAAEKTG